MAATCGQTLGSLLILLLGLTAGKPFISLTGPSQRTTPGNPVPFNCTAGPFSSWDFNVTWMKGRDEHPASAQHVVTNDKGNYSVTSKVWVTLARQDILLGITCEVTHRELEEPLRKTMNLSQVLQVVPTLKITTKTSGIHIHVHQRVNLTCHVGHFYPSHLRLTWMENRHKVQTVESPQVTRNPDGTYSLEHTWQAEATLEGSEFACWVVQDEQPPVQANITLRAQGSRSGKGRSIHPSSLQGPLQRSEPGTSIQLTYMSSGFPSRHVTVTWLKKNRELPKQQTHVHASGDTYNVTSRVLVPLLADDVLSVVQCHVSHKFMLVFHKNISLDQYLLVPPTVTASQASFSLDLVAITCHVQRFYPQSVHLTWTENCHTFKGAEKLTSKQNSDGTYTLESLHLVNVSGQESERVLTCKVQHEAQPPIQANLILSRAAHGTYKPMESLGPQMPVLIFVAFLFGFKVLLVMSFIVTYICRRQNL
ncbi:signal-regulatory protein beta-1-like isoform X1 [Neovison vison]|uniref:signal-regulatory protein beta-1-like isoform X1 n=1 Tax=Neovison vison TaxID=452646 RepID=UPI001CEFCCBE|nr:signal-regulatory protein beta-1-like isoform X1 [Neogale vison]XP_044118318.1 signal-regulatory protein beta-1-like isoform X1 [Neogale vison]